MCEVVILAWDQSILSIQVSPQNESIPHFTVGLHSNTIAFDNKAVESTL